MKLRGGVGVAAAGSLAVRSGVFRYRGAAGMLRRHGLATAVGLAALRAPDRTVLVRALDSMTGRELDAALGATAAAMRERWPGGGRVAVRGDGGIDFFVVLAAAGIAGLDAVAVGPRSSPPADLESVHAWDVFVREGGLAASPRRRTTGSVQLLSTGTTGTPSVTARGRLGIRQMLQLADADRRLRMPAGSVLVLAPPDHGHGLSMVLAGLTRGRTVILASGMRPAEQAEAAARHGVTTISGVPAQLGRLWDDDPSAFDGVRLVVSGSSKLPATLRAQLEAGGARVLDCYGSTETGTVAIDGRPLAGVTIDVDGDQRILITSPLGGRRRDPGDLGHVERGRLVVDGRHGDLVDIGGELLSPEHIADALRAVPGVVAARVWPEPDDLLGSRLCAEVTVSDPAIDAAALTHELTRRVGRAAVPRHFVVSRE
ncbi:MAG: AMP-binding protein [Pseudolysinimonas sp.]